jgi:anthranilate phosphoribosyltransferase
MDFPSVQAVPAVQAAQARMTAYIKRIATGPQMELVDLADPYDGFLRALPVSAFLPALLAACGLPAVLHGCEQVGPKFGVTHRQILAATGVPINLTPQEAASRLSDPEVGWAYVDQSIFCPALHHLTEVRRLMVKRPCLSTLEKLCGPVRAQKNHLVVGFVHQDYERLLPEAARHAGYCSAVVIRGVEGGVVAPLNRTVSVRLYVEGGETHTLFLDPQEAGVVSTLRCVPLPEHLSRKADDATGDTQNAADFAIATVQTGLAALSCTSGPARDALVYSAASILYALGRFGALREAASVVCRALDSGAALAHFS